MQNRGISRVVVWGHKPVKSIALGRFGLRSHTHSYIHAGYVRAFRFLGYETHWLSSPRELDGLSLKNALLFH